MTFDAGGDEDSNSRVPRKVSRPRSGDVGSGPETFEKRKKKNRPSGKRPEPRAETPQTPTRGLALQRGSVPRRASDRARSRGAGRRARGFAPDHRARTRLGLESSTSRSPSAGHASARATRGRRRARRAPRTAPRTTQFPHSPQRPRVVTKREEGGARGDGARAARDRVACRVRRAPVARVTVASMRRARGPRGAPDFHHARPRSRDLARNERSRCPPTEKHSPGPYESNCRARVGYGAMRDVSRAYLDEPEQRIDVILAGAGVFLLGFPRGRSRGGLLRGSPPLRDRDRRKGALLVAGIFVLHSRRGRTRGVRVRVRADVRSDRARPDMTGVGRPLDENVGRRVRASYSASRVASETKKRAFRPARQAVFSMAFVCEPSVLRAFLRSSYDERSRAN